MTVLTVVPGEEDLAMRPGGLDGGEPGFTPSKSPWWSGQETSPPSVETVREPVIADGAQARDVVVDVMHIQGN